MEDEILVYDLRTHVATCLNASAALIWDLCDGHRSIGDIVNELGSAQVTEHHVVDTLDQLREKDLLEGDATLAVYRDAAPTSRRSFLGHVGQAAAASLVLPAVMSAHVPAAAQVVPPFEDCGNPAACNPDGTSPNETTSCCCSYTGGSKCCIPSPLGDCGGCSEADKTPCL